MLNRFREQVGTAGLIVAIVALIAALAGGAYAASGSGGGSSATASAKAKAKKGPTGPKGPKGATGAAGAQGTPGAQGQAGLAGANGAKGATGATGPMGPTGANGTSVTVETIPIDTAACNELGGASVKVAPTAGTNICNGAPGATGPTGVTGTQGDPWTLGNTLPTGATETGTWSFNGTTADNAPVPGESEGVFVPISFPVKLAAPLGASKLHFQDEVNFATHCLGNQNDPAAENGELCVYRFPFGTASLENAAFGGFRELGGEEVFAANAGVLMLFTITANPAHGFGSWAVTGG